jgi:hypothetical protein
VQHFGPKSICDDVLFSMAQMCDFLALNREDERTQALVTIAKKAELVFKMPMNRRFDGGRTDPNALSTQK